ncbi:MAG: hypothetical protein H6Q65_2441 [Firmicutes bacterium]|nr:hypothetical protein [Bacillota bacterium]
MSSDYQDKFPSFDGTNDWFFDKAGTLGELREHARRKEQNNQGEITLKSFAARKEA